MNGQRPMPYRIALIAFALLPACLATRADVQTLSSRITYLETRIERTEDLATEVSGAAQKEAIASRRETSEQLATAQRQIADMTVRIQELDVLVRSLQGAVTPVESELPQIRAHLAELGQRLDKLQQAVGRTATDDEADDKTRTQELRWQNEQQGYDAAMASLEAGDLDAARTRFFAVLDRWPDGKLAANSHYWLGETYYRAEDYVNAIDKYLHVIDGYSDSNKAPAAYLKMGMALDKLGENRKAERTLQDLVKLYPRSEQAATAQAMLQKTEQ